MKGKETWHSRHKSSQTFIEQLVAFILIACGSVASLVVHTFWFAWWFKDHLDVNLLTNIVSLEAIFIGILMLIDGQNKDKQSASQALHFQDTMERMEKKLDAIITHAGVYVAP